MEIPKSSGLEDFSIKPGGVIRPLQGGQIGPIKHDLSALKPALELESIFKDDLRTATAALPNLQADITKSSPTEASLAQSEAIRRVSVTAEMLAEPYIRRRVLRWHARNVAFVTDQQWLSVTGTPEPIFVSPDGLKVPLDAKALTVTDKNFTPGRLEQLNFAMQTITSAVARNNDPQLQQVLMKLAQEVLTTLGIRINLNPGPIVQQMGDHADQVLSGKNPILQQVQESGLTPQNAQTVNLSAAGGGLNG
jgi:hypothetical protein